MAKRHRRELIRRGLASSPGSGSRGWCRFMMRNALHHLTGGRAFG
jgi:hypothetical protein